MYLRSLKRSGTASGSTVYNLLHRHGRRKLLPYRVKPRDGNAVKKKSDKAS